MDSDNHLISANKSPPAESKFVLDFIKAESAQENVESTSCLFEFIDKSNLTFEERKPFKFEDCSSQIDQKIVNENDSESKYQHQDVKCALNFTSFEHMIKKEDEKDTIFKCEFKNLLDKNSPTSKSISTKKMR